MHPVKSESFQLALDPAVVSPRDLMIICLRLTPKAIARGFAEASCQAARLLSHLQGDAGRDALALEVFVDLAWQEWPIFLPQKPRGSPS